VSVTNRAIEEDVPLPVRETAHGFVSRAMIEAANSSIAANTAILVFIMLNPPREIVMPAAFSITPKVLGWELSV
jgi:hypothetical protein